MDIDCSPMDSHIQIFIKPMINTKDSSNYSNNSFVLTVSMNEMIDNLKQKIYLKCNFLSPNRMVLRFNNKILQNGKKLNDYHGLSADSTICVLYKNENIDWFLEEKSFITANLTELDDEMNSINYKQKEIDAMTVNLKKSIESAPDLYHLNQCDIENNDDINMSQLQCMVNNFRNDIENNSRKNIHEKINKLNVMISNAILSINHEEDRQFQGIDKNIKNIEYKIKNLENELQDLESRKIEIESKNETYRNFLDEVKTNNLIKNESSLKCVMNDVSMCSIKNNLNSIKQKRFKQLEQDWLNWDNSSLLIWLKNLNNSYFSSNEQKYLKFFQNVKKFNISGKNLEALSNKLSLNLLGLNDENDQQILIVKVNNLLRQNMKNEFIVKGNRCCACLARCIECVLVPCGHMPYCYQCANTSRQHDNRCPICRSIINDVMKTFIAGV